MEKDYKLLFEQQQVIIERIKRDIKKLEDLHNEVNETKVEMDDNTSESVFDEESLYLYLSGEDEDEDEEEHFDETNMSNNLRIALGLGRKSDCYNNLSWTPPSRSGLDNSEPLLQNERK